ncbi:hypothetical protein ABIF90_005100 [Bradyrhizobium japonicum]
MRDRSYIVPNNCGLWLWVPAFAGTTAEFVARSDPSRHRKAQRLAAARHIHHAKTRRRESARAAIGLLVGLELGLARAQLFVAAPVQRLVFQLDDAVVSIDGLREA